MTGFRTFLAATDFSAPARRASARAARLAKLTGVRLEFIHVMSRGALQDLGELTGAAEPMDNRLIEQAREELSLLAAAVGTAHGISAGFHVATGRVFAEIVNYADTLDADMLILGARGESFMRHLLLGSASKRILRRTSRPVLVVKQTPMDEYRRVLVPVDFSPWSSAAVALARAVAPRAELVLLHAYEVPFEGKLRYAGVEEDTIRQYRTAEKKASLERIKQLALDAGLEIGDARSVVLHGNASLVILEQEQEQDCDLIVLGKHGRNTLERLLLGGVTEHVLMESNGDVLVSVEAAA